MDPSPTRTTGPWANWIRMMAVVRHQAVGTARSMSRLARTTAFSKAQAPAGSPSARSRPASNSAASPIQDSRRMTSCFAARASGSAG